MPPFCAQGSVVEVLARRGRVEFLVCNPQDGQELHWQHTRTVPKPYKGPLQIRSEQDFPADFDVRLAITCWARGAFDVLHSLPPERQMAARPAASSSQSPDSSRSSSGSPESSAPAAAVLPAIVGNNTA